MKNQGLFEWDDKKNKFNHHKHGVSFEEAQFVFADTDRLIFQDKSNSDEKEKKIYEKNTNR